MLAWLLSPSCRYKVFVGARVADIQELTESSSWRYVHSSENPADDITRGLTLSQIQSHSRWRSGPAFLHERESTWSSCPDITCPDDSAELRKAKFCGVISTPPHPPLPDTSQFNSFQELNPQLNLSDKLKSLSSDKCKVTVFQRSLLSSPPKSPFHPAVGLSLWPQNTTQRLS